MIGAFVRIDIPILPELLQHNSMLYTDVDVIFLQPIFLADLPVATTSTVAMGYERVAVVPCNTGVQLYKMAALRRQYAEFVGSVFSNQQLSFGGSQLVNGAFNHFYAESMGNKCTLDPSLNVLVITPPQPHGAKVLHVLGPKLQQYAAYAKTGNCTFPVHLQGPGYSNICELGLNHLCLYLGRAMANAAVRFEGVLVV